jgi:hypothetical protein
VRRTTRRELHKLRELVHVLLAGRTCGFCRKPLLTVTNTYKIGEGRGAPVNHDLTWHHRDGDHHNDDPANLALTHDGCHRAYHARQRARAARRAA